MKTYRCCFPWKENDYGKTSCCGQQTTDGNKADLKPGKITPPFVNYSVAAGSSIERDENRQDQEQGGPGKYHGKKGYQDNNTDHSR